MKLSTTASQRYTRIPEISLLSLLLITISGQGFAANQAYDDFFGAACANPSGQFALRCAQAQQSGDGNFLSGDSESSLNPNQTLSSIDAVMNTVRNRSQQGRGDGDAASAFGRFGLVVNGRRTEQEADREQDADAERGYESEIDALNISVDYRVSDQLVVGGTLGLDRSELKFDPDNPGVAFTPAGRAGDYENDSVSLTLFASFDITERFYVDGNLGYTISDYEFRRNSVFQESDRSVPQTNVNTKGDTDGDSQWAAANVGLNSYHGALAYNTYLGLTWIESSVDSYSEEDLSGSGLAMRFFGRESDSLLGRAGIATSWAIKGAFGVLTPQVRVEFEHNFRDDPGSAKAVFLQDGNQTVFRLRGDARDNNTLNVGAGLVAILPGGWMPYIEYEESINNDTFDRWRFTLGLRVELAD